MRHDFGSKPSEISLTTDHHAFPLLSLSRLFSHPQAARHFFDSPLKQLNQ